MTRRLLALVVLVTLCAGASAAARDASAPEREALDVPDVALYDVPAAETTMFEDINAERARHRLPALELDRGLSSVARAYAHEMLTHHYIGHVTPAGVTPFQRLESAGYIFKWSGENLAYSSDGENAAFAHLVASPGHLANILGQRFTRVGVGAVSVSVYGTMFVQEFAGD